VREDEGDDILKHLSANEDTARGAGGGRANLLSPEVIDINLKK
jgi:hypothetical protein